MTGAGPPAGRIDRHWLRTVAFTLSMVALVTLAMGADPGFAATTLATCGLSFGFFYLLFPAGAHFGMVMANALAVYVCLFAFFRDANFHLAPGPAALLAFTLPVAAFLAGCIAARRAIGAALAERHDDLPRRLPRLARWLPAAAIVGAASFVLPESRLDAAQQGQALVASMAVIALFIGFAARDLVVLLIDVAVVFESVAGRVGELVMPLVAFLTYYALVTLVFTCLYRIVEMAPGAGGFRVHGVVRSLSFAEAMYFSIITMATVGYGDIVPESPLIRALAALEVITGVVLLLFGFREILRAREPAAAGLRRRHDPAERP